MELVLQQLRVDLCVINGGVHMVVIFAGVGGAAESRQDPAAGVWIVNGRLIILTFLLLLPVLREK